MRSIRQFIVLLTMMFWQGGFMFYGGVVVPVGGRILGSETQQGFITQSVTNYLNLAGAVCLIVWAEQLWHERRHGVTKLEWSIWCCNIAALGVLVVDHWCMGRVLESSSASVIDPERFGLYHKLYIGTSSLQWLASLLMLFLAIRRWNRSIAI